MTPTPPTRRRTVFIDVDGTILEHGTLIDPTTVTAIREARSRGHLVFLCTGRAAGDIHPSVREIGVDGEVTNGGAFARDGEQLVLSRPMPREDAERMVDFFEGHRLPYFLQSHQHVYASPQVAALAEDYVARRLERTRADQRRLGLAEGIPEAEPPRTHRPVADADLDEVAKGVFVSSESGSVELARRELGDRFHVIPGSMPMSSGSNGEVGLHGIDKGSGIRAILEHRGLDAADAVGIGDSWNDVEMFEVVGTAVAMGQAAPDLQARADLVTTAVLEGGVRKAFERLGLIDEA